MRTVFVSHPYSDNPQLRLKQADIICKELIKDEEVFVLSPLHLFSFCDHDNQIPRFKVMETCYKLIDLSTVVLFYAYDERVFTHPDGVNYLSSGQQDEYMYCQSMDFMEATDRAVILAPPKEVKRNFKI